MFWVLVLGFCVTTTRANEACWESPVLCPPALSATHSTTKLSSARRNTGAAVVGKHAVFVGGCDNTGTSPFTQFVCDSPSGAVDVFNSDGSLNYTVHLSEKRGWVATCALGNSVVMAGGGVKGTQPHSRAAEILDVVSGEIVVNSTALSSGRWGVSCAAVGSNVFFPGGKVTISGYDNAYMTDVIDVYSPFQGWSQTPYNLSSPRESTTAAAVGGALLVAGGWTKTKNNYHAVDGVDIFTGVSGSGAVARKTVNLDSVAYDVGGITIDDLVYVVGNLDISTYNADGLVSKQPLPSSMTGPPSNNTSGGAIPSSHVPQNGVTVTSANGTVLACFYGREADGPYLYCYDVEDKKWVTRLQCSAYHQGGSIVSVGSSVWVAAGFDPTDKYSPATDIVDIFTF